MPPSVSDISEKFPDLTYAVRHLAQLVEMLSTSLDELTQEVQWRNREDLPSVGPTHLPLTWMPLDPAAQDWRPLYGREPVPSTSSASAIPSPASSAVESSGCHKLSQEIAELKQMAALLVIAISGEDLTHAECDAWDAVVRWAYEAFDADALRQRLSNYLDVPPADAGTPDHPSPAPQAIERQHSLFASDDSEDSGSELPPNPA